MNTLWDYIRIELRKVLTTNLWWILLLVLVPLIGGFAVLLTSNVAGVIEGDSQTVALAGGLPINYLYSLSARMGYFVPLLFGTLVVTNEYRHHTMSRSLLSAPSRLRTLGAKVIVGAVFGLMYGLASTVASTGAVAGTLLSIGQPTHLDDADVLGVVLRTPLVFLLWAVIGVGMGTLVRNQVIAIVGVLAFTMFIEPILTTFSGEVEWFRAVGRFFPGAASISVAWPPDQSLNASGTLTNLDWWQGGLVLALYGLLVAGIGYFVSLRKRDVS